MRLHEEYIQRHRLNIPVVRYDARSNLFLKSKHSSSKWSIFNITWRTQQSRPGFFQFSLMEPVHNGNGAFRCANKDKYVYWDQYEEEIKNVVFYYRMNGYVPVTSRARSLMAWEMFLYMFDGWLAEKMDTRFFQQVQQSTMPDLDFNTRATAFRTATRILSDRFGSEKVVQMLNYQIMPMVSGHSKWLEDLVNA